MGILTRMKKGLQGSFEFLTKRKAAKAAKAAKVSRTPVQVAQGQAALTVQWLKDKEDFEAKLEADAVYSAAKAKRDRAKLQKKAHIPHEDEMRARLNEIIARAKPPADA